MTTLSWIVALAAMVAVPALAAEVNLPVTRVTSFNSGVAYYEHNGKVSGNAEVLLKFKASQINDILKSLVPLDLSGGGTANVSYASQEPLDRALKSFSVDISGNPSLGALLDQVRGVEVTVLAPDKVAGHILGVEKHQQHILPGDVIVEKEYLNLATAEGIRSIPLESVGAIQLSDPKLNEELSKALALLVESRDSNRKSVQVNFTGAGERAVRIGYINEAPIWKTSYRLVLDEKEQGGAKADKSAAAARLQGWAILENTSDFDWDNVDLTLVAGRPISFVQDLYTPLYVPRPEVKPELYASLRPQTYEEGMEKKTENLAELAPQTPAPAMAKAMRRSAGAGGLGGVAAPMAAPAPGRGEAAGLFGYDMVTEADTGRAALQAGVQAIASGGTVGELFSYHIQTPVTLPRRKSAMLPIVNQDVHARKVSIYNQAVLPKNPLNGAWLTNDTTLSLLAGPVTVFDGGTYAGDARLDNLAAGEKRLLSYAIDLEMTVDPTSQVTQKIVSGKIVRGVLTVTRRDEYTQAYALKNKASRERTVVIEHPRDNNRKLLKPAEPAEQTPSLYRFEVEVPAAKEGKGGEGKFTVVEERVFGQEIAILPYDVGTITLYATNKEIPQKVRDALAEAAKRKNALADAQRKLSQIQEQISAQQTERAQLPPVMNALDRTGQAYKTYEKKLMAIETRLDQLQKDLAEQQDKVNQSEPGVGGLCEQPECRVAACMGRIKPPRPAKLVCGLLGADPDLLARRGGCWPNRSVRSRWSARSGPSTRPTTTKMIWAATSSGSSSPSPHLSRSTAWPRSSGRPTRSSSGSPMTCWTPRSHGRLTSTPATSPCPSSCWPPPRITPTGSTCRPASTPRSRCTTSPAAGRPGRGPIRTTQPPPTTGSSRMSARH